MKGSHRQFRHPQKTGTVTVAGKPGVSIPIGTLRSIFKQAGLKYDQVMRYTVVIEKGPDSYGAYAPDLSGCVAVGETREEVVRLMQEAIELHLQSMKEHGEAIPRPSSSIEVIEVAA